MKIRDLIKKINIDYPEEVALDFDNTGFNIGDIDEEIKSVLICLDVDMGAINEAKNNGCNLIISHHPLTFNSYKNITSDTNSKRIKEVIKNDINLYSMHTNFDMNIEKGMSKLVIDSLKLKNISKKTCIDGIKYKNKKYGMGIGFTLKNKIDINTLYDIAIKNLGLDKDKTAIYRNKTAIKKILIMPGSGRSDVNYAIYNNYDLYITSDLSHNDILDLSDEGISYMNLTHYGLEKVFVNYMEKYIKKLINDKKVYTYFSNM